MPEPTDVDRTMMSPATETEDPSLPAWVVPFAPALPRTADACRDLDRIYRTTDVLVPALAAKVRWVVARTVGSNWAQADAETDLRRAGVDPSQIDPDQPALRFAAGLTMAGSSVGDAEVADLVTRFDETTLVALVLQVAFGNFVGRLSLATGLDGESGDPVPSQNSDPARDWSTLGHDAIQDRLEAQRGRPSRVSIPTWDEFRANVPPGLYPQSRPLSLRWSLLVCGRQPELGAAWIRCLRVFEDEAGLDPVFEESLFWVVTRDLQCFYCMGHCEMLLSEAGLDPTAIAARTAALASGDWSDFSPQDQVAFRFARKLTRSPREIRRSDARELIAAFGPDRALAVIWWTCRCQFMTKVSDAFQLPLERPNVFTNHLAPDDSLPTA